MLDILAAFSQYLILVFLSGFIELLAMAWVTDTLLQQNWLLLAHLLTMSLIDRETERNFSKMVKFLLININLESAGTAAAAVCPVAFICQLIFLSQ